MKSPIDRDRVEALSDVLRASDDLHVVALADLLRDHVGRREDAESGLAHHRREGEVIELGDDLRANVVGREPLVQRAPERRVATGDQHRDAVERLRKSLAAGVGELRRREE